jgi:hypothetical protein
MVSIHIVPVIVSLIIRKYKSYFGSNVKPYTVARSTF